MKKTLAFCLIATLVLSNGLPIYAKSGSSSGGRSSSSSSSRPSSSSSSRPSSSSSSRPSSSSSSRPSSSSSSSSKPSSSSSSKPPAAGTTSSKPPTAAGTTSSKPPTAAGTTSSKPPTAAGTTSSKPPTAAGTTSSKPPTAAGTTSSKPKAKEDDKDTGNIPGSSKPVSSGLSDKARAAKAEESRRIYAESKKATAPPKESYVDRSGATVKVKPETVAAQTIRNKPASEIQPQVRVQKTTTIINNNNYSHPYSWYSSQPHFYVGGGYSSAFWWIMMTEWSAERRAAWLYNHQHEIDQAAYQRGLQDAKVQQLVSELESMKASKDPNYVDKDFASDPSLQYDQKYVEAVYNPQVVDTNSGWTFLTWFVMITLVVGFVYTLVFKVKFTR